jgi:hypothetical protein
MKFVFNFHNACKKYYENCICYCFSQITRVFCLNALRHFRKFRENFNDTGASERALFSAENSHGTTCLPGRQAQIRAAKGSRDRIGGAERHHFWHRRARTGRLFCARLC